MHRRIDFITGAVPAVDRFALDRAPDGRGRSGRCDQLHAAADRGRGRRLLGQDLRRCRRIAASWWRVMTPAASNGSVQLLPSAMIPTSLTAPMSPSCWFIAPPVGRALRARTDAGAGRGSQATLGRTLLDNRTHAGVTQPRRSIVPRLYRERHYSALRPECRWQLPRHGDLLQGTSEDPEGDRGRGAVMRQDIDKLAEGSRT